MLKYFETCSDDVFYQLIESIESTAKENEHLTMKLLLDMCIDIGFIIDDEIENKDYSDNAVLILSELFITYNLRDNDYNKMKIYKL